MSDSSVVNVTIAGIPLRLTIVADQEEVIRKAARLLNERILAESERAKGMEPEQGAFLAYVALSNTVRMLQSEQMLDDVSAVCSDIDKVIQ